MTHTGTHNQVITTTTLAALQGSPSHMAPEVLLHGRVSKASDVYSFGILRECVRVCVRGYLGRR